MQFQPRAPASPNRLACDKVWVVQAQGELACASLSHELCDGQFILELVVWSDFATTRLQNRLTEITLN
eukprot:349826-Alexandrium_andersonii.AAC.1